MKNTFGQINKYYHPRKPFVEVRDIPLYFPRTLSSFLPNWILLGLYNSHEATQCEVPFKFYTKVGGPKMEQALKWNRL